MLARTSISTGTSATHVLLSSYNHAKYLKDFTLSDEGYYWETGDEKILSGRFEEYNALLNAINDVFINMKSVPGETPESLVEKNRENSDRKVREA